MAYDRPYDSSIHDPTRLQSSAFDRIAERLRTRTEASKADIERVKNREHCEEAPVITPEVKMDPIEENPRMRVKVGSLNEIPSDFRHVGAGIYKNAHSLWELRTAEDDKGGYVLVRKSEERAVDLRDGGPRDRAEAGLAAPKSSSIAARKKKGDKAERGDSPSPQFETGDHVRFPWKGKIAQAVVIMMMPEGNSAMVDRGEGVPEEMPTGEMSKIDEEGEMPESYMDPGHPELADLGPMDSGPGKGPNPEAPMIDSAPDGESENMGNGESKEGSSDHPFEPGQPSEVTALRGESKGWHPELSAESKHAPVNASRNDGFVRLAIDDESYESRYGYDEPDPSETPLSTRDEDSYFDLPGGYGHTVSEEPYDWTKSPTRTPVRSPQPPTGGHTSQPGDRAPMGELIPDEELAQIYKNMPGVLNKVLNRPPARTDKVNRPSPRPSMQEHTVVQRGPSGQSAFSNPEVTQLERTPSGPGTRLYGPEDPTMLSRTHVPSE